MGGGYATLLAELPRARPRSRPPSRRRSAGRGPSEARGSTSSRRAPTSSSSESRTTIRSSCASPSAPARSSSWGTRSGSKKRTCRRAWARRGSARTRAPGGASRESHVVVPGVPRRGRAPREAVVSVEARSRFGHPRTKRRSRRSARWARASGEPIATERSRSAPTGARSTSRRWPPHGRIVDGAWWRF